MRAREDGVGDGGRRGLVVGLDTWFVRLAVGRDSIGGSCCEAARFVFVDGGGLNGRRSERGGYFFLGAHVAVCWNLLQHPGNNACED